MLINKHTFIIVIPMTKSSLDWDLVNASIEIISVPSVREKNLMYMCTVESSSVMWKGNFYGKYQKTFQELSFIQKNHSR